MAENDRDPFTNIAERQLIGEISQTQAAEEAGMSLKEYRRALNKVLIDDDIMLPILKAKRRNLQMTFMNALEDSNVQGLMEQKDIVASLSHFQKQERLQDEKSTENVGGGSWILGIMKDLGDKDL